MEQRIEYYTAQLLENIEQMEKVMGRPLDVEKAAEGFEVSCKTEALWGEINLLNSHVPAPVDMKSLMTFLSATFVRDRRAIEFYEILRDEIKDRIANGIAAVPNERYRMIFGISQPPWSSLSLFRRLEEFGVVFVTNTCYIQDGFGKVVSNEDGSLSVAKTPRERGWPLRNKEELVQAFIRWQTLPEHSDFLHRPTEETVKWQVNTVKHFKGNAVILAVNRGCKPLCLALRDYREAFHAAGIPSVVLEFNNADFRENDDGAMLRQMEAFLEGQGITGG